MLKYLELTTEVEINRYMSLFLRDYCIESIYSVYKDKLQTCSYNQLELNNMYINIGANNGSEKL